MEIELTDVGPGRNGWTHDAVTRPASRSEREEHERADLSFGAGGARG